jgi:uncharacterized protein (TIGR03000 family)
MYSVILMAALTTSSSTPDWGRHHFPILHPGPGLGYGYTGVGFTCRGWMGHAGVFNGAWAGGYLSPDAGGYGGYGGGYWGCCPWLTGPHAAWPTGSSTGYGGYGGFNVSGMALMPGVNYVSPSLGSPVPPAPVAPLEVTPVPPRRFPEQASATVRIEVPADAKLFVDGTLMKATSAVRYFQTPVLDPNQTHYYDIKVELIRNNQTYTDVRRITVRPGEQASASFAGLEAVAQTTPATAKR